MEYQEFLCLVEKKMNQKLENGITASLHMVVKNNGKIRRGIMVEKTGVNISPTIYLEDFYERFQKGESLECILRDILRFYEAVKYEESWDTAKVENYEEIRDKIVFKLIHTKRNKELLETTPHIELLDLSLVFFVLLEVKNEGMETMLIRDTHLKIWGIDQKRLFPLACKNAGELLPAQLFTMQETIEEVLDPEADSPQNLLGHPEKRMKDMMYVLTNASRSFGAACMLYPGMLETIGLLLGENYYVLPSSVHEVILVPESKRLIPAEMNEMVKEVNETQVEEEEQLSDHTYFYDRRKKQLMMR